MFFPYLSNVWILASRRTTPIWTSFPVFVFATGFIFWAFTYGNAWSAKFWTNVSFVADACTFGTTFALLKLWTKNMWTNAKLLKDKQQSLTFYCFIIYTSLLMLFCFSTLSCVRATFTAYPLIFVHHKSQGSQVPFIMETHTNSNLYFNKVFHKKNNLKYLSNVRILTGRRTTPIWASFPMFIFTAVLLWAFIFGNTRSTSWIQLYITFLAFTSRLTNLAMRYGRKKIIRMINYKKSNKLHLMDTSKPFPKIATN